MMALTAMILFRKLGLPYPESRRPFARMPANLRDSRAFAPTQHAARGHRDSGRSHAPRSPRRRQNVGATINSTRERNNMLDAMRSFRSYADVHGRTRTDIAGADIAGADIAGPPPMRAGPAWMTQPPTWRRDPL